VTFEITVPSESDFRQRMSDYMAKFPWLVCEAGGRIAGYAYASEHRKREAYQWAVEVSVYVADEFMRQGVARNLYTELFSLLKQRGIHIALAGIALPNLSSVHLHESMGFERVALYPGIGFKLGQWHDVGWWQKRFEG
jgi:L-amino acid N-acyltransferase YncA